MHTRTHRNAQRTGSSACWSAWLSAAALAAVLVATTGCAGGGDAAPRDDIPLMEAEQAVASGVTAHGRHEYHIAITWFDKAIARYRSIDNPRGVVVASLDLADTLLLVGEHEPAQRHIGEAASLVAANGLAGFDAHIALLEAYAQVQSGDDAAATTTLATLLAGGIDGDTVQIELAARMLAADIAVRGDPVEAGSRLVALETQVLASDDPVVLGRYRRLQADLARREGRFEVAAHSYADALTEYRRVHYRPGLAATHEALAQLRIEQQQWMQARDHLERALHIRLWVNDRFHSLQDMQQLAQVEERLGNSERARQLTEWQRFLHGDSDTPWQMLKQGVGAT